MAKIKKEKKTLWQRFTAWVNGDATEQPLLPAEPPKPKKNKGAKGKKQKAQPTRKEWMGLSRFEHFYRVCAVVIGVAIVSVLMVTVLQLPLFGSPDNPAVNEVVERYVEKGLEETGAVNMVAGMILDYRAFDTFGESSVLFLAVTCVTMLLMRDRNNTTKEEDLLTAREPRGGYHFNQNCPAGHPLCAGLRYLRGAERASVARRWFFRRYHHGLRADFVCRVFRYDPDQPVLYLCYLP